MPIVRPIGEDQVAGIAAIQDPVLRNLWITTAYHDLARGMTTPLGGVNLSWPAFATWASKTAGASIRGEELPTLFKEALHASSPVRRAIERLADHLGPIGEHFEEGVSRAIDQALAGVSRHIAEGNLMVFQELGPLFGRMVKAFGGGGGPDAARRAAIIDAARAADGDVKATAQLRIVFAWYWDAASEPDRRVKAERILFANALTGLTEQVRLQPKIKEALDAPIEASLGAWLDDVLRDKPGFFKVVARPLLRLVIEEIESLWRRVATEHLITLGTPDGRFRLFKDVPADGDAPRFPQDLSQIRVAELVEFLAKYDRTGGTGIGSGARDWSDLDERMSYIVNLFRSRQQDADFLRPPFLPDQWTRMEQGEIPTGTL
jgi:hypothetical protein